MTLPTVLPLDIIDAAEIHKLARKGDGIEVSAVAYDPVSDSCEVCEPKDATMWSVYIHRDGRGVQCVADWKHKGAAFRHALELLTAYANLAAHGICDGSL